MTAELVTAYVPRGLPPTGTEPDTEFEQFYNRYHACVLGYAWKLFGPVDAEDIAQETMARAFAHFDRLDPERDPWPWLCVVARHVGTDIVRSHARTVSVEDQRLVDLASTDTETPFDQVQAKDERSALRRALALLSPNDRRVLRLREYDDLSASDIAALLDCSETAVRQQLFRARRRLAQRFRAVGGTAGVLSPVFLLRSTRARLGRAFGKAAHAAPVATSGGAIMTAALISVTGGVTALTLHLAPPTVAIDSTRAAVSSTGAGALGAARTVGAADDLSAGTRSHRPAGGGSNLESEVGAPPVEVEVENEISDNPIGRGAEQHQSVRVAVAGREIVRVDRRNVMADDGRLVCDRLLPTVSDTGTVNARCD